MPVIVEDARTSVVDQLQGPGLVHLELAGEAGREALVSAAAEAGEYAVDASALRVRHKPLVLEVRDRHLEMRMRLLAMQ